MSKMLRYLPLLLLASCAKTESASPDSVACDSPFAEMDASQASAEDRQIIREASEDFCAVALGNEPIHAKPSPGIDAPSDGGSRFYVGRKYKLTALNSLSSFGGFAGSAYGPIITFDDSFATGHTNEISYVRVRGIRWAPADGR